MSISLTFNGTAYTIPSPGDTGWADSLNDYLAALAGAVKASGGTVAISVAVTSGRALTVQGDTTSPVTAAFRLVPQDTQPSGASLIGDMYVTSAGVLKICTVAGTPGTWVSVGGQ